MESSLSLDVRFINRFMVRNILEEIARGVLRTSIAL